MEQLSNEVVITKVADGAISAGTAVNGTAIDLAGYDGVAFFCSIATANAGNYLSAQEGDTSSPTADLAGSKVVAASNGQVVLLDICNPLKRYVRPVLIRAGANTVSGDIYAIKYKGKKLPPAAAADVVKSLVSPVAGTP